MDDQLRLFDNQKRFRAFKQFHANNPQVFAIFKKFAQQALDANRRRFGARMIGERIRWYTQVETVGEDFKLSNNHLPYYARLLMVKHEEFDGFFTRRDDKFDATDEEIAEVPV